MKVSICEDVVSEVADGEVVLLHLKQGAYYALDAVGSRFWTLLQAGVDVEGARTSLLAEFDVSPDQLAVDLDRLLQDLLGHGLIRC